MADCLASNMKNSSVCAVEDAATEIGARETWQGSGQKVGKELLRILPYDFRNIAETAVESL
jgi:hypothetical protein